MPQNLEGAEELISCGVGEVFAQPLISGVAALHANNDHGLFPAVQETLQSPGLSIGGIRVKEQIVSVKEIHDRESLLGHVIMIRKIDVKGTVFPIGGVDNVALDNHSGSPFHADIDSCDIIIQLGEKGNSLFH